MVSTHIHCLTLYLYFNLSHTYTHTLPFPHTHFLLHLSCLPPFTVSVCPYTSCSFPLILHCLYLSVPLPSVCPSQSLFTLTLPISPFLPQCLHVCPFTFCLSLSITFHSDTTHFPLSPSVSTCLFRTFSPCPTSLCHNSVSVLVHLLPLHFDSN